MQRASPSHLRLIVVLFGAVACQPTFPDGVSQVLENMRSRQPTVPDDRAKVEQLIAAGSASLTNDVIDELLKNDFEKVRELGRGISVPGFFVLTLLCEAAYAKTHLRVVKYKFVGGCPRVMTGCPSGWKKTESLLPIA